MTTSLFTFEWPSQSVESVYVTGTFDNWSKSTKLVQNKDGAFTVTLEVPKEKIVFKYIVDGTWLTTSKFKVERDSTGIENNVIYPEDLSKYNEDLTTVINLNENYYQSFNEFSPDFKPTNTAVNYRSDTDTSAFTNISVGDISPFDNDEVVGMNRKNKQIDDGDLDDESFKSLSDDDLMFASTQGTILGGIGGSSTADQTPTEGSRANSININQQKNLVSLQNNNGSRQVRYYTSMSVLDRFKKYFK